MRRRRYPWLRQSSEAVFPKPGARRVAPSNIRTGCRWPRRRGSFQLAGPRPDARCKIGSDPAQLLEPVGEALRRRAIDLQPPALCLKYSLILIMPPISSHRQSGLQNPIVLMVWLQNQMRARREPNFGSMISVNSSSRSSGITLRSSFRRNRYNRYKAPSGWAILQLGPSRS
jgi:hypothetical protein